MLRLSLKSPPPPRFLDTSKHDLVRDFFEPSLAASVYFDRGVGFFSSGWLRVNAQGLSVFASNGGRARWITSPILSEDDWRALRAGADARDDKALRAAMQSSLDEIESRLESDTLNTLAWLVADNILDFKLAVPRSRLTGEFHDKFGVFTDQNGDSISFNGSYNDSLQGLRNYESIKVFRSWEAGENEFVHQDAIRFERLWNNQDENVEVFGLNHDEIARILKLRTSSEPPYVSRRTTRPSIPASVDLRPYQREAIRKWFQNNGRGIWKMATGTGKTITALALAAKVLEGVSPKGVRPLIVIVCPYLHLVDQWNDWARRFGFRPILCYGSRQSWASNVSDSITELLTGAVASQMIITTNATFGAEPFQRVLASANVPLLLIADEVHNVGSRQLLSALPSSAKWRLGLSATPERHRDKDGTEALTGFFGEPVFEMGIAEAIQRGFLTPYRYYPILVDLDTDEWIVYEELTRKIAKIYAADPEADNEALRFLLLSRARVVASARRKIPKLIELVQKLGLQGAAHTLVYCGDGSVDSPTDDSEQRQVEAVVEALGSHAGMRVAKYTAETPGPERRRILSSFEREDLQALVAIRCLDEGVDIPATRRAFILASSSNPRQFIQRRGRVLRPAPGKDRAEIWDFLVIPGRRSFDAETFNTERGLIKRELLRVLEFAETAENGPQTHAVLRDAKREYNLLDL